VEAKRRERGKFNNARPKGVRLCVNQEEGEDVTSDVRERSEGELRKEVCFVLDNPMLSLPEE